MESPIVDSRRLQISLRLKAARWLNGSIGPKGATVLSTTDLAARPELAENGISRNRIEDIEQMTVDARPMELEKLARALGVDYAWLRGDKAEPSVPPTLDKPQSVEEVLDLLHYAATLAERYLGHMGRDQIGRRAVESRQIADRLHSSQPTLPSAEPTSSPPARSAHQVP